MCLSGPLCFRCASGLLHQQQYCPDFNGHFSTTLLISMVWFELSSVLLSKVSELGKQSKREGRAATCLVVWYRAPQLHTQLDHNHGVPELSQKVMCAWVSFLLLPAFFLAVEGMMRRGYTRFCVCYGKGMSAGWMLEDWCFRRFRSSWQCRVMVSVLCGVRLLVPQVLWGVTGSGEAVTRWALPVCRCFRFMSLVASSGVDLCKYGCWSACLRLPNSYWRFYWVSAFPCPGRDIWYGRYES